MKDIKGLMNLIKQLFVLLDRGQKKRMLIVALVVLIGSLFELIGVSAILPFVQSLVSPYEIMKKPCIHFLCNKFNITTPSKIVALVGIGIILVYFVKNAYLTFAKYLQAYYCNITYKELAVLMLRSYLERGYSFFVENGMGTISNGVINFSYGVYLAYFNLLQLISELLVVIFIALYLVSVDWILAIGVLFVGISCLAFLALGLRKTVSNLSQKSISSSEKTEGLFYQICGGVKDILVYSRQEFFLDKYERAFDERSKALANYTFVGFLPERIIESFCVLGLILTIIIRYLSGISVDSFIPNMAVFAMGVFRLLPSISRTTGYINTLVYYRGYVEGMYNNVNESKKYREKLQSLKGNLRFEAEEECLAPVFSSKIKIHDLYWSYSLEKGEVIKGLSLEIHKGEVVGIVGASGSGKSTLADILLRLYHPQSGEILMDGVNIDAIPEIWSKVVGYVTQSSFLVDDTIRNNIAFGSPNVSDDRVWESLKRASLSEFVSNLPEGLDTIVGERGVKFSGGQRQRVAIARALYNNPQVLIMDEATSSLDSKTEESVMEAIDSLAGTMTLVIIAHRVSTLRSCNRIYEIVDGIAVERKKEEVISIK